MKPTLYTIGIDEAGRGPLAGPVAIGVVKVTKRFDSKLLKNIKDSKKLTSLSRTEWFQKLKIWKKEKKLDFHVSLVSHTVIDKKGISAAIKSGIKNSLKKVKAQPRKTLVLLDGSLKAPEDFVYQKTIIKGDEKIPVISLASIAAKVTRDSYMCTIAKKYPEYSFEIHKGYGTKIHRDALKTYGPSKVHRRSFLKNFSFFL